MKKENKNSNTKNLIIAVAAVAVIVASVVGGTFAWWSWTSNSANANENTAINFTIATPTFKITGTNVTGKTLAPTNVCYGSGYTLTGRATVVATNNTTTQMETSFVLSGKLTPVSGRTLSADDKSHIHWAIKQVDANNTDFSADNCTGTNSATFATGTFSSVGTSATNITTPITYTVNAGVSNDTKYYQLYVWIDSGYKFTNVGSGTVTDPMQDMTVLLTFSNTSKFEQVQS